VGEERDGERRDGVFVLPGRQDDGTRVAGFLGRDKGTGGHERDGLGCASAFFRGLGYRIEEKGVWFLENKYSYVRSPQIAPNILIFSRTIHFVILSTRHLIHGHLKDTAERSLGTLLISPAAADTEKVPGTDRYDSITPSMSRSQKAARPDVTSEQSERFRHERTLHCGWSSPASLRAVHSVYRLFSPNCPPL
jgi:hypothetical protein